MKPVSILVCIFLILMNRKIYPSYELKPSDVHDIHDTQPDFTVTLTLLPKKTVSLLIKYKISLEDQYRNILFMTQNLYLHSIKFRTCQSQSGSKCSETFEFSMERTMQKQAYVTIGMDAFYGASILQIQCLFSGNNEGIEKPPIFDFIIPENCQKAIQERMSFKQSEQIIREKQ